MSALRDAAAFATDERARGPLTAAVVLAATQISTEDHATANHQARVELAWLVIRDPVTQVNPFLWAVSSNPTVVAKWVGGDLDGAIGDFSYVVASVWDAVAGAAARRFVG